MEVGVGTTSTGSRGCGRGSGPGFRPEDLPRAFDRFWRAPDAPAGGTGLGLSIAAWIAERHGGSIDASNRARRRRAARGPAAPSLTPTVGPMVRELDPPKMGQAVLVARGCTTWRASRSRGSKSSWRSSSGPAWRLDLLDARASSFEAVYNAHYRDVSRHVILTTRGRDDVEEIVAETFARAFAAWRSGHGPAGRPLPWLLVIARRIATDRWRRRRLIAWLPLPDSGRSSAGTWDGRHASGPNPEARTAPPAWRSSGSGSTR